MVDGADAGFTIGEIASQVGVSASTLRLWEAEGLVSPTRDASGRRRYTPDDLVRLRQVRTLRTVQRINAAAIRQFLGLRSEALASADAGQARQRRATGRQLREMRRHSGLSLAEAAARSGFSVSYISSLERGVTGVSFGNYERLVGAYEHAGAWFERPDVPQVHHTGSGRTMQVAPGASHEWLSDRKGLLEPVVKTIEPGVRSGDPVEHDGEELVYVLEGSLDVTLEGRLLHLAAHDSLHFPSHELHWWLNPGPSIARVLWVTTEVGIWSAFPASAIASSEDSED